MHVADKMFQTLCNSDRFPRQRRKRLLGSGDGSQVRQAVRLAALCHDLGHPPFSHAVEATFKRYPSLLERAISGAVDLDDARLFKAYSHEEFTRWSIRAMMSRRGSIANRIRKKLGKELSSEIADLAIGKASGVLEPFNPIISGEFDADRIDYLIRDNRRSGFVLGLSLDEIHNAIHLNQDERDQFRLFIDASALPFVSSVLLARQRLIRRVHLAPSGRVATQMMINCLFCILDRYQEPAELAKTIKWLHVDCTDFTFFRRLLKESESVGSLDPLNEYYVRRFERVARRPHATNLWPERVNIDFMQMHPCLRLLAHIVASSNWKSPRHLTFQDRGRCYFIEPNTRPSQASDLQVDYGRNPHDGTTPGESPGSNRQRQRSEPSLDFVGAS
jgi:HD superfamily phosphohydrolase